MSRVATLLAVLSSSLVGANWTCEKKSKLHGWNTAFALTHNSKPASQETSPGDIMTWHALVLDPANDDDKVAEITGAAINVPTNKWETQETISFPQGDVFTHCVHPGDAPSWIASITGGTGEFVGAYGQIKFTPPPEPGASGPWGIEMSICTLDDATGAEL